MGTHGNLKQHVLIAVSVCIFFHLFMIRSAFVFIPAFAAVLFVLWKKGGGRMKAWEEDDPADWWKKGQKWSGQ